MKAKTGKFPFAFVIDAGLMLVVLTAVLACMSVSFPYPTAQNRPIVSVVFLSWFASAVVLAALYFGLKCQDRLRSLVGFILLIGISARLILIFTNPILEIDYYRYLWDGIAANSGVAPYKYSPEAVQYGIPTATDQDLRTLQKVVDQSTSAKTIVARIHFGKYTTLYPPVSQLVFRITTALIPDDASVYWHIVGLKFALALFDIGTGLILAWLLALLGKHPAWLMAYFWNPLVLKEVSNGGHLDSIAVFFMTAGVAAFLWIVKKSEVSENVESQNSGSLGGAGAARVPLKASLLSGALMSLGLGAKLFPVIFMPAMAFYLFARGWWKHAVVFTISCALVALAVMWPMTREANQPVTVATKQSPDNTDSSGGLAAFMTQWRMNDAIFSGIYQNVEHDWDDFGTAWYVVVPNENRLAWFNRWKVRKLKEDGEKRAAKPSKKVIGSSLLDAPPPFFIARITTIGLFGVVYLVVLWQLWRTRSALDVANLLFLIVGFFFYLQPTQNPWYWLWAMPLVCFAKNKGWLFVSLILFVYYLRFWYEEENTAHWFINAEYRGVDYFDHCIVWIEFAVVVAVLRIARFIQLWLDGKQLDVDIRTAEHAGEA